MHTEICKGWQADDDIESCLVFPTTLPRRTATRTRGTFQQLVMQQRPSNPGDIHPWDTRRAPVRILHPLRHIPVVYRHPRDYRRRCCRYHDLVLLSQAVDAYFNA
jgi:hypothetical protein